MTDEEKKAWESLVKEADCATAAGCGCGRLIHGHYKVEWEIAWRKAILAKDAECRELRKRAEKIEKDNAWLRRELHERTYNNLPF